MFNSVSTEAYGNNFVILVPIVHEVLRQNAVVLEANLLV